MHFADVLTVNCGGSNQGEQILCTKFSVKALRGATKQLEDRYDRKDFSRSLEFVIIFRRIIVFEDLCEYLSLFILIFLPSFLIYLKVD